MAGKKAYHGGAFFDAVGDDFSHLERGTDVISADVLDAWFDPSPKAVAKLQKFLPYALKTSPPTHAEGLIATIAEKRNIPRESILVAGGSSDIMFLLFPNLLAKGDSVLILDPMYGEYRHIFENVVGANLLLHTLDKADGFAVNVANLLNDIADKKPAMVVMVNPNSPTGGYVSKEDMMAIVQGISPETCIVVDETYIDYVDAHASLESYAAQSPNVVVMKSMSKVYALSGVRAGYLVAGKEIIEKISPFVAPWSVSLPAQIAAVEALNDPDYYREKYKETHVLRETFIADLSSALNVKIYDSCANFFLVELLRKGASAQAIVEKLRAENIFIRNCDSMSAQFHDNFLRIAVKDKAANAKIVEALKAALA